MADTKITGLQTPGAFPVVPSTDVLPIVIVADNSMAASGSTRKVTVNQILGAGGTATLASATISGDLTVRTNKLKVDATGVAIGATSATYLLDVRGTDTTNALIAGTTKGIRFVASASTSAIVGVDNTGAASYQPLSIGGSALDFSLSGSTAMTLNSTGLGVGTASPAAKLYVASSGGAPVIVERTGSNGAFVGIKDGSGNFTYLGNTNGVFSIQTPGSAYSDKLIVDSSGNVVVNTAAVATTATDGFLYITGCAGTPTGTPTAKTGRVPLVVDTTNNKLYFYSGGAWVAAN